MSRYSKTPVLFDAPPVGKSFGQVLTDVESTPYGAGDTVFAAFVGANPRVSGIFFVMCNNIDRLAMSRNFTFRTT